METVFLSAPDISGRERFLVNEAFDSNYVAPAGSMLTQFEADMVAYTGIKYAVALSSGTAALHLALLVLGIGKGDEVWTSSMTFMGGASPIAYLGATPVFFDLAKESWCIDCDLLEEELKGAARKNALPKAIVSTDLYGQSCDLDRLIALGETHGIAIVTDSAEALGAFYHGRHAGKGSRATILSFNGNKIITTSGGGMLLSDDKALIDKARYLSTQARQPVDHYEHVDIGYNYRLSNISAAIGIGQLEMIENKVAKRRANFQNYFDAWGSRDGVTFMPEPKDQRSTRWLTCMSIDADRAGFAKSDVIAACKQNNIEVRPLWKPMHLQPVFAGTRFVGKGFCEQLFETGLCLPSGSGMKAHEQQRVIDTINQVIAAKAGS